MTRSSLRVPPIAVAALAAVGACAPAPPAPLAPLATDSARFEDFVARYPQGFRASRDRDDPLARLRVGAVEARVAAARTALAELRSLDTAALTLAQRLDWAVVEAAEKRVLRDTVLREPQRVPGRYITLGDLYWRVAGDAAPTAEDWASVRTALRRAPEALAIGRAQLVDPPPRWIALAVSTAEGFIEFLRGEFGERAGTAPDSLRGPVLAAADSAARALAGYAAFLQDTLAAGAAGSWAVGSDYYDWVLRESNFLPYTAESMIAEGYRIHEATKAALDSLADAVEAGASWRGLVAAMQERHPTAGAITEAYRRASRRVQALLIRDDLITLPACQELLFVPTPPANRATYAWGGYGGIRERDGVMYGRFFVTDVVPGMTADEVRDKLRAQNDGWISVIALHEGYPGHHLQQVYARRNPRPVRRRFSNTYFGEGWALYAEHWMRRAGLFETVDQQLAQLQMRLWRTARVIIDPSLHTGRMSYDQAVQFFVDEVGLTRPEATAEVDRYTTWPTQAPSYIIGWLEIERLKIELQDELGDRFDEKRFHETLLEQGSLPLALMRRAVWAELVGG